MDYATVEDLMLLWRPLTLQEQQRAAELLPVICASLRTEAKKAGRDLDAMTDTDQEPMTQFSQSAGGCTASGTFLVPGGGLFIKKSELARLGLRRQRYGVIELYGEQDTRD